MAALAFAALAGASTGQAPPPAPPRDFSRADESRVNFRRVVARPAMNCGALQDAGLGSGLAIERADEVAAAGEAPAYCHLVGTIEGRIRFEMALPAGWNGRLLQIGNGGVAGEPVPGRGDRTAQRVNAVRNGFVFTANDMGHVAERWQGGAWAENNADAIVDFGDRAHHLNNQWARRIAQRYYGQPVARAYYSGCSTGGRSGYAAAQRHPEDFDGVLAGAPVHNLVSLSLVNAANAAALTRSGLTAQTYAEIGKRMVAKCDMLDGVRDGVIADPRQCRFDLEADGPLCGKPDAMAGQCLTPPQVAALKSLTADVVVNGRRVYPGKVLSAENMARFLPSQSQPNPASREAADYIIRSMALYPEMGPYPQISWETVDLQRDFDRVDRARAVLEATNPDLSAFRARGGKMITYIGWEDTGVNPRTIGEYWEAVAARLGRDAAADTFRVFMVPGMGHCAGGAGAADYFDLMTPLVEWVEAGVAPQSVVGVKRAPDGSTRFSRKLCPYPQSARYNGGEPNDAASYSCAAPTQATPPRSTGSASVQPRSRG